MYKYSFFVQKNFFSFSAKPKKRLDKTFANCYNYKANKADGSRFTLRILFFRVHRTNLPPYTVFSVCVRTAVSSAFIFISFFSEVLHIATKELQINEEIRDKEVRVITDDGEQLGVMSAADALKAAQYRSLDLVKIAPQAQPPVCKIMDYGKYRFDRQKREKEAKKNQKVIEIKEVQLSLNIDTHDLETKVNHAIRFLKAGNKVKVSIRFRGREMVHPERGYEIMQSFADACSEYGTVEKPAKLENRNMLMFLAAKVTK